MADLRLTPAELVGAIEAAIDDRRSLYGDEMPEEYYGAGLYTGLALGRYEPERAEAWLRSFEAASAQVRGVPVEVQETDMRNALRSEVEQ